MNRKLYGSDVAPSQISRNVFLSTSAVTSFSIDSYSPLVIDYVLNKGFKIVNDITGLKNDEVCKVASKYDAKVVIMHMQNDPTIMQTNPTYEDVVLDIDNYFATQIKKAKSFGIQEIILDVGIGFGKTLEHNLKLLKNLEIAQILQDLFLCG